MPSPSNQTRKSDSTAFDLINFDLVTFEDIQDHYQPNSDIFVIYRLGPNFVVTKGDWVGLFETGWSSINQYLTSEPAPEYPKSNQFPEYRSVIFSRKNIQVSASAQKYYQLLYVARGNLVVGVSKSFRFINYSPEDSLIISAEKMFSPLSVTEQDDELPALLNSFEFVEKSSSHSSIEIVEEYEDQPIKVSLSDHVIISGCTSPKASLSDLLFPEDRSDEYLQDIKNLFESENRPIRRCHSDHVTLMDASIPSQNNDDIGYYNIWRLFETPQEHRQQFVKRSPQKGSKKNAKKNSNEKALVPYMPIYSVSNSQKPVSQRSSSCDQLTPLPSIYCPSASTSGPLQLPTAPSLSTLSESAFKQQMAALLQTLEAALNMSRTPEKCLERAYPIPVIITQSQKEEESKSGKDKGQQTERSGKTKCKDCKGRIRSFFKLKKKNIDLQHKLEKLQKLFEEAQDKMLMKDLVVTEFSKQVKSLVSENSTMSFQLERLNDRHQAKQEQLDSLSKQNQDLSSVLSDCRDKMILLEKEKETLSKQLLETKEKMEQLDHSYDTCYTENIQLKLELSELKSQHEELEQNLDNIMYTLSTKGLTKLIDTNGNEINLDTKQGTLVELSGWEVAKTKKTVKEVARAAAKDDMVQALKCEIAHLKNKLDQEKQESETLKEQIQLKDQCAQILQAEIKKLEVELEGANGREQALSTVIISEHRLKQEILQRSQSRENQLNDRIKYLERTLQAMTEAERTRKLWTSIPQSQSIDRAVSACIQTQPVPGKVVRTPVDCDENVAIKESSPGVKINNPTGCNPIKIRFAKYGQDKQETKKSRFLVQKVAEKMFSESPEKVVVKNKLSKEQEPSKNTKIVHFKSNLLAGKDTDIPMSPKGVGARPKIATRPSVRKEDPETKRSLKRYRPYDRKSGKSTPYNTVKEIIRDTDAVDTWDDEDEEWTSDDNSAGSESSMTSETRATTVSMTAKKPKTVATSFDHDGHLSQEASKAKRAPRKFVRYYRKRPKSTAGIGKKNMQEETPFPAKTCIHCGAAFPPYTDPERITQHMRLHEKLKDA